MNKKKVFEVLEKLLPESKLLLCQMKNTIYIHNIYIYIYSFHIDDGQYLINDILDYLRYSPIGCHIII